jgi:hypothetical protein
MVDFRGLGTGSPKGRSLLRSLSYGGQAGTGSPSHFWGYVNGVKNRVRPCAFTKLPETQTFNLLLADGHALAGDVSRDTGCQ